MKRFRIIIIALLMLILTGCNQISAGEVTKKYYQPPHVTYMYVYNGTSTITIPQTWPGCHRINIEDQDQKGSYCLKRDVWSQIELGDWIDLSPDDQDKEAKPS